MTVRRMARLGIALIALVLPLAVLPHASAADGPTFRHYVALGDSFASGPLIPLPRLDPLLCGRSTNNYAALLAGKLGLRWKYTDKTCGGANTSHMTNTQALALGTHAPQFNALRPDTDLVSISIGGNDYGVFGSIVGTCPTLRAADPMGSPCRTYFTVDGVDTLSAAIASTKENITAVLQGIHERSPNATVLVVGYPRLAPTQGTCAALPLAAGDYQWADSLERELNAAAESAAAATGSLFVDTYTPSLGHDICAGSGAWVNGKDLYLLAAAPYHPFYAGMAAEAALSYNVLAGKPVDAATAQRAFAAAKATQKANLRAAKVDPNTAELARTLRLRNGAELSRAGRDAFFPIR